MFHAIQYLMGLQTQEKLEAFRGYKGVQSYPSRTKDADDVDFSTGSVGLGVAQTIFSSLVQDYVRAHGWGAQHPEGLPLILSRIGTFWYFFHMFVLLPVVGWIETPKPLPA